MAGDPGTTPDHLRRRRRTRIVVALVVLLVSCAVTLGVLTRRNAPGDSRLDRDLKGVDQPKAATQPTTPAPKPVQKAEGPCWTTYARTAARTSDASELAHGIPKRRLWAMRIGVMEFPPSFCNGVLYVNSQAGFTWAINARTHGIIWKRRTAQIYDSTPAISGPRLFVGSYEPGTVVALDRATGRPLWTLRTGAGVESSPVAVGGIVYAASRDRRVYAIDERTGRIRWAFLTGGEVKDSPSVAGGLVYVANYAAEVFALDAARGTVRWRRSVGGILGDRIYSSVPVVGGRAYFASVRGNIYSVNARTGDTRWQQSVPGYVYSTPAIAGGRLFIGNYPGNLYAFDARTGRRLWQRKVGGSISGSPTVIGDVVYVSSLSAKRTVGFSVTTGRQLWEEDSGKYVTGIATSDGLYFSLGSVLQRWSSAQSDARAIARARATAR